MSFCVHVHTVCNCTIITYVYFAACDGVHIFHRTSGNCSGVVSVMTFVLLMVKMIVVDDKLHLFLTVKRQY